MAEQCRSKGKTGEGRATESNADWKVYNTCNLDYKITKPTVSQASNLPIRDSEPGISSLLNWLSRLEGKNRLHRQLILWKLPEQVLAPLLVPHKQIGDLHYAKSIPCGHTEARGSRAWPPPWLSTGQVLERSLTALVPGMTNISLARVHISLRVSEWLKKSSRSAMSSLEVSYPVACTISGSRDSWDSNLYCCKSVAPYPVLVFACCLLKKKFLYALVDL